MAGHRGRSPLCRQHSRCGARTPPRRLRTLPDCRPDQDSLRCRGSGSLGALRYHLGPQDAPRSVHRNIRRVATERGSTRPASCRRDGRFGRFRHGLRGRLVSHALSRLWFFDLRRLDHAFHLPSGSCRRLCLGILSVTKTHRASFLPRSELAFDRLVRGCLCQPAGYAQSSLRLPEPLPVRTRKGPHPFRNPVRDCCRPHAPCHAVPGCDASRRGGGAPVVQERSRPPCFLALHGQLGRRRAGGGSCRRGLAGKLRHRAVRARRIPRCADRGRLAGSARRWCRAERVPERR